MNKTILILDVPNLCYRNWYANKLAFSKPIIHGLLRDLITLSRTFMSNQFTFCFDHKDSIRKKIYPQYKATRDERPPQVMREMTSLREEILPKLGYKGIYCTPWAEADDVIAYLCRSRKDDESYVLVSTDSDLYQLLDTRKIIMWNMIVKCEFTELDLYRGKKVKPSQWALAKSISGCDTDNIQGVHRVGQATACSYLNDKTTAKVSERIRNSWGVVMENEKLIKLPHSEIDFSGVTMKSNACSKQAWEGVTLSMNFDKLAGKCP